MLLCSYLLSSRSIRGNICSGIQGVWTELTLDIFAMCRLKSVFEKFLSRASCSQLRAVSFRAILCLACETVLRPRSRLVDFNQFYCNSKVTRGEHKFQHENTGTRARSTKARVLDMLLVCKQSLKPSSIYPRTRSTCIRPCRHVGCR